MFRTNFLQDDQSYIVADYDSFSLTVGVLVFEKRVPRLVSVVRSFFPAWKRDFHPRTFEKHFTQCCRELREKIWTLPHDVCLFLDHGELLVTSTGYTFTRGEYDEPVHLEELDGYASQLLSQSETQAKRIWHTDCWYHESDRKLLSIFLSHLALDKRHHTFPLGKNASQVTMRSLFFYGNKHLLSGLSRSIRSAGFRLISCIPLSSVFLNHLCNKDTFLENHLHIHLWYDATTVVLHLWKHVQEICVIPFWWNFIDQKLTPYFSPLERESLLTGSNYEKLEQIQEWQEYRLFLVSSLRVAFESIGLQWSFSEYTISGHWPTHLIQKWWYDGELSPWIQKRAHARIIGADPEEHWLHYIQTLDPLFTVHPHPLLALVRSVFLSSHESI